MRFMPLPALIMLVRFVLSLRVPVYATTFREGCSYLELVDPAAASEDCQPSLNEGRILPMLLFPSSLIPPHRHKQLDDHSSFPSSAFPIRSVL